MELIERVRRFVAACPDAIAGQGGHATTFRVVCSVFWGFGGSKGLSETECWAVLNEYNGRLGEKWTERDLQHKVRSVFRGVQRFPQGHLVDGEGGQERPIYVPAAKSREKVKFDAEKLARVQRAEWKCDFAWLRARSSHDPMKVECGAMIDALFDAEERVMAFTAMRSVGDYMRWRGEWFALGRNPQQRAQRVKEGPKRSREGCVMLIQPVDGAWHPVTGKTNLSRRTMKSVTAWRHMLWESDEAPHEQWLNALAQVRMPIVAITTSGGRSLHALVRVDAESYDEFSRIRLAARECMTELGFDPHALSNPTAAMRLPNTWREGKMKGGQFEPFPNGARCQRLIYFNPEARVGECIGDRVPADTETLREGDSETLRRDASG